MQCRQKYNFVGMSLENAVTGRRAHALARLGLHLIDKEGDCFTCLLEPSLKQERVERSWKLVAQWCQAHFDSLLHVKTIGHIPITWCSNCGPWVDDDGLLDAEKLLDLPLENLLTAALHATDPMYVVEECTYCTD